MMPNQKDFVSIRRTSMLKKSLLLLNLNEIYNLSRALQITLLHKYCHSMSLLISYVTELTTLTHTHKQLKHKLAT